MLNKSTASSSISELAGNPTLLAPAEPPSQSCGRRTINCRTIPPVRGRLRILHPAYGRPKILLTTAELPARGTVGWWCSHGSYQTAVYGASNIRVVVAGIPVYVAGIQGSPYVEAVEGGVSGLDTNCQRHGEGNGWGGPSYAVRDREICGCGRRSWSPLSFLYPL